MQANWTTLKHFINRCTGSAIGIFVQADTASQQGAA